MGEWMRRLMPAEVDFFVDIIWIFEGNLCVELIQNIRSNLKCFVM